MRADIVYGRDGRSRGYGTVRYETAEEAEAAIEMLSGLSDEARAYLWQSTNKGWKDCGNPFK